MDPRAEVKKKNSTDGEQCEKKNLSAFTSKRWKWDFFYDENTKEEREVWKDEVDSQARALYC